MKTPHNAHYEEDPTPSCEVAQRYRESLDLDDGDERAASLALLHYRGGEDEFQLGKHYSGSSDSRDRATGADILSQLGWHDHNFQDESVAILTALLGDPDPYVIYRAAVGLGHRSASSAIPDLVRLSGHSDPLVRYGVVFGLSGQEDDRAIAALIHLAKDDDHDVRNWAVFGLGSQIETDSPMIRTALREALQEPDHEIRGEALVGLAKRGDPAIVPDLLNEWRNSDISILSIEAAEETRDSRLYPHLMNFTEILNFDDDPYFAGRLADAIKACTPETEQVAGRH